MPVTVISPLKIGVFGQIDKSVLAYLSGHDLVVCQDTTQFVPQNLLPELDGVVIRSPFSLNDESSKIASRLRWIVRAGSGTDNISPLFAKNGVDVRSTPMNAHAVAELVIGLVLCLFRNVKVGHESLQRGEWLKQHLIGRELRGKKMGIVGYGRIGRSLSLLSAHFGVTNLAYDRSPFVTEKQSAAETSNTRFTDVEEVVADSDIVVACMPGTEETAGFFDESLLRSMKKDAIFVNVGRGSVVDIDSLTKCLEEGQIGGAALDVFKSEPPGRLRIFELPNVLCTPHLGAQTLETHRTIGENVIRHLRELTSTTAEGGDL